MYALTKRNSDAFNSIARDFFGFDPFTSVAKTPSAYRNAPRFDLVESPTEYLLRGDLPGLTESEVEITLHDGLLTISGTRSAEEKKEEENFLVRERRWGQFSRQLRLPKDADAEKVSAKLEHGVLSVSIGKKEESKARKIQIG